MPKAIALYNQHIGVQKGTEIDNKASEEEGSPVVREVWTFVFTDKTYGDETRITFNKETRDQLVKDLMGGLVLPTL